MSIHSIQLLLNTMNHVFFFFAWVATVSLLSGCGMPIPEDHADIRLGGIFALSGVGASIGQEEERGARLAVEQINAGGGIHGKKIEWVVEDISIDKMSNTPAAVYSLLHVDNVTAIIGPTWDEPAAQILPIVEEAQVPIIMPDATDDLEKHQSFTYAFSTWHDNAVGLRELLRFAERQGIKTIAIVRPTNGGFWQYTADILHAEASRYGVEIIQDHNVGNPLEKDWRTILTQVKAGTPDAMFAVVSDYNQCVLFKQFVELDLPIPLLATESAGNPESIRACADLMQGRLYFSSPRESSGYARFAADFEEAYGHAPQFPSAATAYDAVMVFAEAYDAVESGLFESLRYALAATEQKSGASSDNITFDDTGFVRTPEDGFMMMEVREGAYSVIE